MGSTERKDIGDLTTDSFLTSDHNHFGINCNHMGSGYLPITNASPEVFCGKDMGVDHPRAFHHERKPQQRIYTNPGETGGWGQVLNSPQSLQRNTKHTRWQSICRFSLLDQTVYYTQFITAQFLSAQLLQLTL